MMSLQQPKVGFVSLGCPKALVDSERILTQLRVEGYDLVQRYDDADVVVVNTCGFIDSAVAESLDAIGEAMAENGKVIVTGCLGKRSEVIREAYPDVLSISGPQDYASVMDAVHLALPPKHDPFIDLLPDYGLKLTPKHYAYLKISEGCNHRCSFCIIPSMRGDLVSRPVDEVLREAEKLVRGGVKELLVVSQDTSAYGVDLKYATRLWRGNAYQTRMKALCEGLSGLGAWTRLHYVYPYPHVDEIIPLMAEGKLLPYLDIPFQHASPRILKLMKRPGAVDKTLERIQRWRAACPELTIRSTFIVGLAVAGGTCWSLAGAAASVPGAGCAAFCACFAASLRSFSVTPIATMRAISASSTSRGRRYLGMPKRIMPPAAGPASSTVTA